MADLIPSINYAKGDEQDIVLNATGTSAFTLKSKIQGLLRQCSLFQFFASISAGGGAAVANGDLALMKSMTVKDTIHGTIWQDLAGLDVIRMMTMLMGAAPARDTLTTSVMGVRYPIKLGHYGVLRHPSKRISDMALWEFADTLLVQGNLGSLADILSGATGPAATVRLSTIWEHEPSPNPKPPEAPKGDLVEQQQTSGGDRPLWMPEILSFNAPNLQVGNTDVPMLIGQGRIPLWIFFSERDNTGAEVSDIFTKYTTAMTFSHGKTNFFQDVGVTHFDKFMGDHFAPGFSLPAGWHAIPLIPDSKILDSVTLDPVTVLNLRLSSIATAANRALKFFQVNAVPIPGGASPEAQLQTLKA